MLSGAKQLFGANIYADDATAQERLGSIGVTRDGRVYRYCENGGSALAAGKLAVAATIVANHENMSVASAVSVGATSVTVTLGATAATLNDYAEGYLTINDVDGEGISYLVSGHPAASSAASLAVTLQDPVQVALTTNSQASLQKNPWKDIVISATDQADMPVGIPNVAITADQYGWVQVRGFCSALADETLTVGASLTTGSSVAGAVEILDAAGEPEIGYAIQAGVDTEYRAIFLTIE